ncbi:PWWP domain-containing protein 5-like [Vicia villosa]|uniref:PWWP domain-containing protein 5-like n=1 Tax=Vicia villosa TaxID=3911 RepID=UPI00273AF26A|nr:PWWP domain-containing protein 5-like [Vicia villosa]
MTHKHVYDFVRGKVILHNSNNNSWTPIGEECTLQKKAAVDSTSRRRGRKPKASHRASDECFQNATASISTPSSNHVELEKESSSPTALTLKFTHLDLVPSAKDVNEICGRFGPLIESKTELIERMNCVRVVFKRRVDAESAFIGTEKYNIFGPSLKSYRLKILPPMPKNGKRKRGRKSKNDKSFGLVVV